MSCTGCIVVVLRNHLEEKKNALYTEVLRQHGYRLEYVASGQSAIPAIEKHSPVAVCFQFDYPDLFDLTDLRRTKQLLPSVPLLMITQAHSEQLAVWAFRARVWDYFVEPVDTSRLLAVIDTLNSLRSDNPARSFPHLNNAIPPEARMGGGVNSKERSILDQALTYVDANLHRKIVQKEVAASFGLSTFQFSRLFKRLTQVTFQQYLLSRRIETAKRLLENPGVSITDVCYTVGFQDLSYFTRIFQRHVGLPPSRYRQHRKDRTRLPDPGPMLDCEKSSTKDSRSEMEMSHATDPEQTV